MKVKLLFLVALLGLSGCIESPERHLKRVHKHKSKQGSPAYAEGYKDGCGSAYYLAGDKRYVFQKNALRTQQDALYSKGWREGHQICHHEASEQQLSKNRLHQRLYYHGKHNNHSEYGTTHNQTEREAGGHYGYNPSTEQEHEIWDTLKK